MMEQISRKISYDMEGHAQKCVERYCELANKKTEQLHKFSSLCLDDDQVQKKESETKVICQKFASTLYENVCTDWHDLSQNGLQACAAQHCQLFFSRFRFCRRS